MTIAPDETDDFPPDNRTPEEVRNLSIRRLRQKKWTLKDIAERHGMSKDEVVKVLNGGEK